MNTDIVVAPSVHRATKNLKWKARYDTMVMMRCSGYSNEEIGEATNTSPSRVSNILNSQLGQEKLLEAQRRLRERGFLTIEQRLSSIGSKAIENIAKTVEADISVHSRKKVHQDKVSFEALALLGFGKKSERPQKDENGGINKALAERLVDALEKSAEATRIIEMDADDAEFI